MSVGTINFGGLTNYMKLFKKRNQDNTLKDFNNSRGMIDPFVDIRREALLEEYANQNQQYHKDNSEESRLRMIEISEQLSPKSSQKKSFKLFGKKEKFEEKYCHTCKHNLKLHHKKGRSTGCRKCGCLRTLEEIMNPSDNGHDNAITAIDTVEDKVIGDT